MEILFSALSAYSPFGSESLVAHHYARVLGRSHGLHVIAAAPTDLGPTTPGVREVQVIDIGEANLNEVSPESLALFEIRQWGRARRLTRRGIDLVHRVNPCSLDAPTLLAYMGKPLVVGPILASPLSPESFREIMWRDVHHYKASTPLHRRLAPRRRVAGMAVEVLRRQAQWLRRARKILVGSALTMESIPPALHARCEPIVYAGVEHEIFTPPVQPRQRSGAGSVRLLYAGRLKPHKGLELLLKTCATIRRGRAFTLTVVGKGTPYFEGFVHSLVSDLGLGDLVTFLPPVSRERMPDLYRDHDVFCLPTLSDTYGVALLEAMSSGMAVVASDLGGPREIVAEGAGIRIPVITPDQFVSDCGAAVADLIDYPVRIDELGGAARRRILKCHDWETIGSHLEEVYESIA